MSLSIVIMAAGKGTRMKSSRPKVLHKLAGRPMLSHVIASTSGLNAAQQVVITGHGAEMVEAAMTACNSCVRSRNWAPAMPCNKPCPCCLTTASP